MKPILRCKACGYLIREDKLGDVCPACGLKRKVFEPYESKISPRRKFILDLDLHPILVHFPQSFCSILPPLVLAGFVLPTFYPEQLVAVVVFLSLVMPLSVVGAIVSGLIDGKVKLKKLRNPAPLKKILVGNALLVLSIGNALLVALAGYGDDTRLYVLALSAAMLVCAVLLGMMGKKLINAVLPG